jgi:hypothetical protein
MPGIGRLCEFMSGNHGAVLIAAQQIAAVARRRGDNSSQIGEQRLS